MNIIQKIVSILAVLMMVSPSLGCQFWSKKSRLVGPDYVAPAAKVSPDWIDFNNPNVISAAHAVDDQQWWNVFGDPEIAKIVSAANQGNLTLQAAWHRTEQQQRERAVAVGDLFPQGQEGFAEYQRNQFSDNGNELGILGLGNTFDLYKVGFNASWEIDFWGRIRRTIEASSAQVHASIEDQRDIRLSLTADVISAYTEMRVYQQRISNAHEQTAAQEKTLLIAKSKFKNGSVSKLDLSQAQATLEVIRSKVPGLESQLRHSNNRLCLLLGIPPRDLSPTMGPGVIPFTPDSLVVGMPRDLLRRRPDVRQAERTVAEQSALIGVAKADLYPTFSLRGTINWQSFNTSNLLSSASNAGSIIPGVRWDILNYGRNKNRVKAQEARFHASVADYRQAVLNANTEVENSLNGFLNKKKQVVLLERAVESLRESLRVGAKQYKAGTIEFDRLNDLRKELVDQQDDLAVEQGNATLFLIRLYKTMGGGWAIPTMQVCNGSPAMAQRAIHQQAITHRPVNQRGRTQRSVTQRAMPQMPPSSPTVASAIPRRLAASTPTNGRANSTRQRSLNGSSANNRLKQPKIRDTTVAATLFTPQHLQTPAFQLQSKQILASKHPVPTIQRTASAPQATARQLR